jgi:tRNA(Ile)-lysidine synthase
MHNIENTIKTFLKDYNLDNSSLTYLVGFSGGYDSMCLLHALKKIAKDNKIVALHLNHKWRGDESDLEEMNCKNFCEQIGVEFYCEDLSSDISQTETAARDARYRFFEKCGDKYNSDVIFTAHNKNDNAETIIYRICKGTGISGLKGIAQNRGIFYRPLLSISREEIEKYCKNHKLTPNNDSSNSDIKYKRNYIRAKILPVLNEINPNSIDMINSLSNVAKEESQIIDEYLAIIKEKISEGNNFQTKKFLKLSKAVQKRLIYNMFIENNLDYDQKKILNILDFIEENSVSKSGKTCSLTNNLWIFVSDKIIKLVAKNKDEMPYFHITKEGKYKKGDYVFEIEPFVKEVKKFPKETEDIAYVDLSKFDINFEIRTRQDGDVIQPFGLDGSQKLKKYLNSKKIPNHEKDKLLFLVCGKEILWAINYGISDRIKVVKNPTHRLRFYKEKNIKDGN